ncbi:MAG: hypothetical protein IJ527_01505 [Prevotella sp.]|nr:hypothetical protein [Prevotella sp.]
MNRCRRWWLRGTLLGVLSAALGLFTACNAESEFSSDPCYLLYHNAYYLDQTLAESMNPNARGIFCHISESQEGGYIYLNFRNTNGQSSRQRETALETKTRFVLGLNNGIIVGFQSLNETPNGGFVAYDEQCPNCVRKHNSAYSPKYRLTTDGSGIATCSVCGKRYNMNNRGIILNPEENDVNLKQYIATTTGPQGDLFVHNQ